MNRPTEFEVEVIIDGRQRLIAGYTARKTKKSLLYTAMDNDSIRSAMLKALPADDNSSPRYNAKQGWQMGNSLIRWSCGTRLHPIN